MDWLKKAIVLFYLGAVIGASWVQLALFLGIPAPAGIIITPSDYPWLPPLSVVFFEANPTGQCQGWSLYFQTGKLGPLYIQVPTVHYFDSGYMVYNNYVITGNAWTDLVNYFKAMIWPSVVVQRVYGITCPARVVAAIPGEFTVLIMALALSVRLYYKFRRVW